MKRLKELEANDIVGIAWADACGRGGWMKLDDIDGLPAPILTVGLVIYNNKTALTVAQSVDTSDGVDNFITVPWCNITAVEVLG